MHNWNTSNSYSNTSFYLLLLAGGQRLTHSNTSHTMSTNSVGSDLTYDAYSPSNFHPQTYFEANNNNNGVGSKGLVPPMSAPAASQQAIYEIASGECDLYCGIHIYFVVV